MATRTSRRRSSGSPVPRFARGFGLLPGSARDRMHPVHPVRADAPRRPSPGPPSVAHAEALLRGVEARSATLDAAPRRDRASGSRARRPTCRASGRTRCWPPTSASASRSGSGATRSRSSTAGRRSSSTGFTAASPHPTQQPYRALFHALRARGGREPDELAEAEREAAADDRGRSTAYRAGRSCHPLLPFADWAGCAAGARAARRRARRRLPRRASPRASSASSRPTASPAALEMAHGRAGRPTRASATSSRRRTSRCA